ncbi:MAG TPA: hypothetical protein PKX36_00970 [Candidatus Cloacimonadota bacterium]|nr:hypothetical protein [Candidatus Cloacimonadota bacterium]
MVIQQKESGLTLAGSLAFIAIRLLIPRSGKTGEVELTLLLLVCFIFMLWIVRHFTGARLKALDEMDLTIRSQAAIVGAHGFGAVVMIFAVLLYLMHRGSGLVPLQQVINLAYYSWLSLYIFWSGAILILYKTGAWHVGS